MSSNSILRTFNYGGQVLREQIALQNDAWVSEDR